MDTEKIYKIRIRKLKDLVDKEDTIVEFCKKWSKNPDEKPLNETYISQLLNGYRKFGERSARRFERTMYLDEKYFDGDDDSDLYSAIGRTRETLSVAEMGRIKEFLKLTPEEQLKAMDIAQEEREIKGKDSGNGK